VGHEHQDHDHAADGTDPFDEQAAGWDDDPAKVARAAAVARAVSAAVVLGPSVRLLEYGAGTGLVTEAMQHLVGHVVLADTSAGMRQAIDAKIDAGALRAAEVWDLDLTTTPVPAEQHGAFDVVVTVMVLHHIADLPPVLARFAELLAPGGHLCIADLEQEDGSFHGEGFAGHHGFERPALAAQLGAAGFRDVTIADCTEMVKHEVTYQVFLAIGTR
jgi:2-polyprenyl-3-methyl-5-hydroxy-6-metoxy-1,4-benzoquinol methylase